MNCNCWDELDKKLLEKNLRLIGATYMLPSFFLVPEISTEWIDSAKVPKGQKRLAPAILSSYCPFCGTKIEMPKDEEAGGSAEDSKTTSPA